MGVSRAEVIPCGFPDSLFHGSKLPSHCPFPDPIFTKRKVSMSPFNSVLIAVWEIHKWKRRKERTQGLQGRNIEKQGHLALGKVSEPWVIVLYLLLNVFIEKRQRAV